MTTPGEMLDPDGRPVRCMTVDVQTDCYHLVIRMWARNGASRLRWTETVTSTSRLRDLQLEHQVISDRVYLDGRHDPEHVKQIAARYGWRVLHTWATFKNGKTLTPAHVAALCEKFLTEK